MLEPRKEVTRCEDCGNTITREVWWVFGLGTRKEHRVGAGPFHRCHVCAEFEWRTSRAKPKATSSARTDVPAPPTSIEPSDPHPPEPVSRVFGLGWRSRWPSAG